MTKPSEIKEIQAIEENQLDEFASEEFLDPNATLPRIQALRGTSSKSCGYFVTIDQMAKADWRDLDPEQLVEYTFESSGKTEQGILFQAPRFLVCPKSPLLGYDREASQEEQQTVIKGIWDRSFKEMPEISPMQFYQVILLDKKNQPLHNVPFSYAARGANQATFAIEWRKLVQEITNCHAVHNSIPSKPKNLLFSSLCVFVPSVKREQVGQKQKSFTCRIAGHLGATMENWKDLFIGYGNNKQFTWDALSPEQALDVPVVGLPPQKEVQVLPSVEEARSDLGFANVPF